MLKLKRSLFLFFILPFALWACAPAEEPVAVEPAPVVEEEVAAVDESVSEEAQSDTTESEEAVSGAGYNDTADVDEAVAEIAAETVYAVDAAASTLTWTGAKSVGDSHTGSIDLIDGELIASGDSFISGSFNIDMTTIADSGGSGRLENHLMSDDFFGVETFPTANLEIMSATPTGEGSYDVVANLTMKDITNEITFPVTVDITDGALSGTASIVFDRSLWDVRYGSGSFFSDLGNDLINDEIELEVSLTANG